jgi:hypothetical protein
MWDSLPPGTDQHGPAATSALRGRLDPGRWWWANWDPTSDLLRESYPGGNCLIVSGRREVLAGLVRAGPCRVGWGLAGTIEMSTESQG